MEFGLGFFSATNQLIKSWLSGSSPGVHVVPLWIIQTTLWFPTKGLFISWVIAAILSHFWSYSGSNPGCPQSLNPSREPGKQVSMSTTAPYLNHWKGWSHGWRWSPRSAHQAKSIPFRPHPNQIKPLSRLEIYVHCLPVHINCSGNNLSYAHCDSAAVWVMLSAMYNAKLREGPCGKKECLVPLVGISCSGMSANSFLH